MLVSNQSLLNPFWSCIQILIASGLFFTVTLCIFITFLYLGWSNFPWSFSSYGSFFCCLILSLFIHFLAAIFQPLVFMIFQTGNENWNSTFQPTTNSKLIPATFIIFMNCRNLVLLICVCSVPKCITFDLTTLVDCLMIAVRGAFITCV